jgi:hypothetical protein
MHHQLPQHDELFAVEGGDSDNDDEVVASRDEVMQGDPEEEGWDNVNEDEIEGDGDRQILMGNVDARRSWADLAAAGEDSVQGETPRPGRESLSAKAGIILVCRPPPSSSLRGSTHYHTVLRPLGHTQHLCRHPAVPRHRLDSVHIRYARATQIRAPWGPPRKDTT